MLTSRRPAPGGVLGEDPADDQADGQAATGDGAPDAEGPGPLAGFGEGDGQQREGRGGHQGGEAALQGPGGEEQAGVGGEAADAPTRPAKPSRPDQQDPLAPHVVGDAAAEEQQAAEGQRVGRDHPLPVGGGDVQGVLGVGRAMLTIEASTTIISWAMARTARIHQRRSPAVLVSGAPNRGGVGHAGSYSGSGGYGRSRGIRTRSTRCSAKAASRGSPLIW